jgi:type I restriction enzyme S subunit
MVKFKLETEFQDTKIGKIPREWKVVRLENVLLLLRNGLNAKQNKDGIGYPITRIETISEEKIDVAKVGYVSGLTGVEVEKYRLIEGDILFSHINSLEHIGKAAIYEGVPELLLHGVNLLLLRPDKKKVHSKFLLYLLHLYRERKVFWAIAKRAVNQASINQTELKNMKIFLPPLNEQVRIAMILSIVDRAIEVVDAGVARLEGLKKALMRELLTGRIRVREENGKLAFYRETEFQETEIGKIQREWKIVNSGELFEFQRGLSYRKNDLSSTRASIRFVTINDLEKEGGWKHNGEPVYLSDGFKGKIEKKHVVDAGDLLIAITDMSKGFIIGAPLYINENLRSQGEILVYSMDLVKLQPKKQVNALFYYYQLSWSEVRKTMKSLARGTNVLHLDLNSVKKRIKLVEPPLDEQQRIAEILSIVDRVIELYREERIRLDRLKRGLMDLLLTGKVRVVED